MEDRLLTSDTPDDPLSQKPPPGRTARTVDRRQPAWIKYAFAVIVTLAALWGRRVMEVEIGDRQVLIVFLLPIILSAYLGGLGPGLVSTAIAAAGLDFLFIPPAFSFYISRSIDYVQWVILIVSGTLVSVLSGALHSSRRSAEASNNKLSLITNAVPALVSYIDANGRYLSVNQTYELWFGLKQEQILGRHVREVLGEALWEQVLPHVRRALTGETVAYEQELLYGHKSPRWISVNYTPDHDEQGRVRGFIVLAQDISRRKRAEQEGEAAVELLRLVNESPNKTQMVRAALTFFRQRSGCEAVGIRLRDKDDYPYYETNGFSPGFVLAENSLCSRSDSGEIIRDSRGNPVLECMCGNVICGRFDPAKPFFTKEGSFWTNSTTELLASTTESDRQARTRNRCHGEGYESVALIPLHVGEDRLGLLQLNDRRKGRFTPEDIALWERLAGYLAVTVAKFKAEELLCSSEELYRSLFNNMLNGFAYCRMVFSQGKPVDFTYLAVNDAFAALTGLKDVVGKNVSEVIPGIHESDPELFEIYARVALSGKPETFETYVTALSMWFSISVYSPKKEHFVAVFDVITERKLSEEALRESKEKISQILNSTAEGIYGLDQLGNCVFCNQSCIRILGYKDENDLIGKNMHELAHHTNADGTASMEEECDILRAFHKGEYVHNANGLLWRADGKSFPAEYWTYPILKDGRLTGAVVSFIDITDRVSLEKQFLQSQKMESIGHLAGGIAHDFNNMLTAIIGYGSLLNLKLGKDSELKPFVGQILSSAEKSANLTKQLLAFSRKQEIAPKETDLNGLIKGMEKLLLRLIGEDIELKPQLADKALIAMVDPGQIEQVLMNLSTNARDAMPDGGLLSISTDMVEPDERSVKGHDLERPGKYALISVTDTGVGMDEQTQQKIFEPFFTTKEVGRGTGLGLSIVYGIVKQHGGSITVYSEPGRGTSFRIYLPLSGSKLEGVDEPEPGRPESGTETILLAEDNEDVRVLTKTVLEGNGYKVIDAVDGEDAISKFKEDKDSIQLIVIDVVMPRKSGKEAIDEIKKIRPGIRVLFTSGYTADIIGRKGILEEGMDFISKPVTPNSLLAKIRGILDK